MNTRRAALIVAIGLLATGFSVGRAYADAPVNDNRASSQTLSFTTGSVSGDTTNATAESSEPDHDPGAGTGGKSVWYQWTALNSGGEIFDTCGSSFNTVLAIYHADGDMLLQDDSDGPSTCSGGSQISLDAVALRTYLIAVDGDTPAMSPVESGPLTLNWRPDVDLTAGDLSGASERCKKERVSAHKKKKVCRVSGLLIKNAGTGVVDYGSGASIDLYLTPDDLTNGALWGTATLTDPIDPGASVPVEVIVHSKAPDAPPILVIDGTDEVVESNEANNQATLPAL